MVWFWFLFDRSAYRIVCLLACLIGQLLYVALFDCSLFARQIGCFLYFYCLFASLPLGCHCFSVLPLLFHVLPAVYIHVSACVCSYSLPPPPSLSPSPRSVCLSVCLPACLPVCLSVCPSVCLSVCQPVSVSHPHLPPLPLSPPLFVPLFLYSIPPSPCVLCPLLFFSFVVVVFVCLFLFVCFCFFVCLVGCCCFLFVLFVLVWFLWLSCFVLSLVFFVGFLILHVHVLSVCNIVLIILILYSTYRF